MPFLGGAIGGLGSLIGGLLGAGGSLASAGIGASAAQSAANTQAASTQKAIDLQRQIFLQIIGQLDPFLQTGYGANYALESGLNLLQGSGNTGALLQDPRNGLQQASLAGMPTLNLPDLGPLPILNIPDPSDPATIARFQQSPGYTYELGQQQQAIQNSAAGRTGALSGNMLEALQSNAQGLASQDYNNWLSSATGFGLNTYNAGLQNALTKYNAAFQNDVTGYNAANSNFWNTYNARNQDYWNQYNASNQQQGNIFSRLLSLFGAGQNAAANAGNAGLTTGQGISSNLIGQGNALAAGQVGTANALSGGIQGVINAFTNPYLNSNSGSNFSALDFLLQGNQGQDFSGGYTGGGQYQSFS